MLKINTDEYFDLNKVGLIVASFIGLFLLFLAIDLWVILLLETCLAAYMLLLLKQIKEVKSLAIIINDENKYFIQHKDEMLQVYLKDYWMLTGYIFIWLSGSKKSISFVVSRSIIGPQKFSQIHTKIK